MYYIIIIVITLIIIIYYRQKLKHSKQEITINKINAINMLRDIKTENNDKLTNITATAQRKVLRGVLYQALTQMDTTCNFYTEEDEANRELTSCLNVLGHDANYHYSLGNGRTCDIFVDNSIIEGKLDLNDQTEVDRLIGQINDYLVRPHDIYIVLYGRNNPSVIGRIETQLLNIHPNRISLIYLPSANRIRRMV